MPPMIGTALALAARGMHVFPCRPRAKMPATDHGFLDATTETDTIRQWWRSEPAYNVAIATGTVSKVFAVDVDGLDAEFELRKLETEHGELPPTVEAITARGRHLYFRTPELPVRNSTGKIAPGIDVRGDGGYTLCPPSIHPSGKAYAWSVDSASAFASAPDWLLARITERRPGLPTPPSEWRELVAIGVAEGRRDCTVTKITGYLLRRYVDPIFVLELMKIFNMARCTPPLPEEDVERIVNSIAGKELKRRGGNG
jgi:Bifunctional DNA primase/polymerase, N-terminal/Primase C terminal 1 (PriCT-1)